MKKSLMLLTGILTTVMLFSQAPSQVILLLNIGQSNVVGRASIDPANEVPATPGTYWYKQSTNSLEPLVDAVGEDVSKATDRSMNPMLGKRLKELTGYDVIIVPAGVGNTFISYWQKSANDLYTRAKTMWQQAISYCAAHNITIVNKYAHWLQGENDAGYTETDGYYVMLNQLVNDLISDVGVEKVFATRIGYDPNYTSAANSEKIMKAQKILNFNNPNFIMASTAPPTFTYANGKMAADQTHHTLAGLNEEANDIANSIQYYRTTGQKPSLPETVSSLQSVTSGYINLTPNWSFDFNDNIKESSDNVTMTTFTRSWANPAPLTFNGDSSVVIPQYTGLLTSRPFSSSVFTVEIRFKMNSETATSTVLGNGDGDNYNKLVIAYNNTTPSLNVQFGTGSQVFAWDLGNLVSMATYHTFKFVQGGGVLKFYLDGAQIGPDKPADGLLTLSRIGAAAPSATTDMDGDIDFFKIKNTVDNISALPIKFKSFKATNIK